MEIKKACVWRRLTRQKHEVGENMKMLCQCDGTVIWESSPDDFLKRRSKVSVKRAILFSKN